MSFIRTNFIVAVAAVFILRIDAVAAPKISAAKGTATHGARLLVQGDGFGEKTKARPILFADFSQGIQPSPKGESPKWDKIENMVWAKEGVNGKGCAKAADGSGKWTLGLDHEYWSKEGAYCYVFRRQKLNFTVTDQSQNWKIWRMYPKEVNYPNIYMASNNGRVYVENIGQESGFWSRFNVETTDWVGEEIFFQASSTDIKNGVVRYQCNGVEMAHGSVMTRSTKAPDYMTRNYPVHGVNANPDRWSPGWLNTNRMWVDEVYVDTTWSRVMLGDKPLRREGRKWEIEVPVRWSNGEIEIVVNAGVFKPGETAYLFVFDSNDNSNETGYPVTILENSVFAQLN